MRRRGSRLDDRRLRAPPAPAPVERNEGKAVAGRVPIKRPAVQRIRFMRSRTLEKPRHFPERNGGEPELELGANEIDVCRNAMRVGDVVDVYRQVTAEQHLAEGIVEPAGTGRSQVAAVGHELVP